MPFLRKYDVPVVVNIWGRTLDEYGAVAEKFDSVEGVSALEVNVSCPNIKEGSGLFGTDVDMFGRVVSLVRGCTTLPVIPKLAPNVTDIAEFARAAEGCGADAISLINSFPAMAIDVETRRPKLANVTGGLSGPAIHPIAVRLVWQASQAVNIPVVGVGGIHTARDAIEFIIAGATAVAVGTANFTQPSTATDVVEGIEDYLVRHGLSRLDQLVGSLET
jgi:dihydroorotate dehydrogenase (NAD+) catalytic subunit